MNLKIYYDNIKFRIRDSRKILRLIEKVIRKEKKKPGDLSFIITTDKVLIGINREFLKHDYFTDVIAFSESNDNIINGEIYISIETVKNNATNYKVSLKQEVIRVMIHGTLHLCGYSDNTVKEKKRMREVEDYWINRESKEIWNSTTKL